MLSALCLEILLEYKEGVNGSRRFADVLHFSTQIPSGVSNEIINEHSYRAMC